MLKLHIDIELSLSPWPSLNNASRLFVVVLVALVDIGGNEQGGVPVALSLSMAFADRAAVGATGTGSSPAFLSPAPPRFLDIFSPLFVSPSSPAPSSPFASLHSCVISLNRCHFPSFFSYTWHRPPCCIVANVFVLARSPAPAVFSQVFKGFPQFSCNRWPLNCGAVSRNRFTSSITISLPPE